MENSATTETELRFHGTALPRLPPEPELLYVS